MGRTVQSLIGDGTLGFVHHGRMSLSRARLRYLSAIGIILPSMAAVACGKSTTGAEGGVTATATATGRDPQLNFPPCPNGSFCVTGAASALGSAGPAPAPYEQCTASVYHPDDVGHDAASLGRRPAFNADKTKTERAKNPAACCYTWVQPCPGGRAFRDEAGVAAVAAMTDRTDWMRVVGDAAAFGIETLSANERASLAAHWAREAAFEHASIASFSQLALDLMVLGAPPELLEATHRAALDEIEHARITFALASAYGGRSVGPSALDVTPRRHATMAELARSTFLDGCVGESLASAALAEAARRAHHPSLSALLAGMAADEERHAELAWRIVAWARTSGGAEVALALDEASRTLAGDREEAPHDTNVEGHGTLDAFSHRALRASVLREIVTPCVRALA